MKTKVRMEIHQNGVHEIHTATFKNDRMIETETDGWDDNGKTWYRKQEYHALTYWQKSVSVEDYLKDKESYGAKVI